MIWHLSVILLSQVLLDAFADEVYKLKAEIEEKKEYNKLLARENADLELDIKHRKELCESELKPLKAEQENRLKQVSAGIKKMEELASAIEKKQQEELMLNKALAIEFDIEKKYLLKVELYKQDLQLLGNRNKTGVAQKCEKLKPLFAKYQLRDSFSSRSSARENGFRQPRSNRAALNQLQADLNTHKISTLLLKSKNEMLTRELNMNEKHCEQEKRTIQDFLQMDKERLERVLHQIDMFVNDLNNLVRVTDDLKVKLRKFKETNEELKRKSERMKREKSSYAADLECYKTVSVVKVNYRYSS